MIWTHLAIRFEVLFDLKDRDLIWDLIWNICKSIREGFKSRQIIYFLTDAWLSAQIIRVLTYFWFGCSWMLKLYCTIGVINNAYNVYMIVQMYIMCDYV